jgi:hypothetical protein
MLDFLDAAPVLGGVLQVPLVPAEIVIVPHEYYICEKPPPCKKWGNQESGEFD